MQLLGIILFELIKIIVGFYLFGKIFDHDDQQKDI